MQCNDNLPNEWMDGVLTTGMALNLPERGKAKFGETSTQRSALRSTNDAGGMAPLIRKRGPTKSEIAFKLSKYVKHI